MKLCFLAAANSIHSHRWVRYFADEGHDVHWISLVPFDEKPANIVCHDLSGESKWWGFASAVIRIRGLIRRIAPDIVHAHYAGTYGVLGAISGFQPYVLTAWGSDVLLVGREKVRGVPVRWALRKAKLVTCDAYHMIDAMQELGTDPARIELVYFGIDADRFSPGAPDQEILSRWGARGPVVISLRTLEPIYNIETLLEAVPEIVRNVPDVRVVVCGSGSAEAELKKRAADLEIERNVIFTGRYANAELPRMLRSASVYVSTSLSDAGIAASTAEAMGCGIAAVVTNTGENDKWIEEGKTGFLVAARDSAALAARVVTLLTDERKRQNVGLAGRQVIVERNNYVREMDKVERYYRALLSGVAVASART